MAEISAGVELDIHFSRLGLRSAKVYLKSTKPTPAELAMHSALQSIWVMSACELANHLGNRLAELGNHSAEVGSELANLSAEVACLGSNQHG